MSIRKTYCALLAAFLLSISLSALAKTIHVPADEPTIQAGINAASNGDTVLVAAGTYYENINFSGKAITLTSVSGPAATIIDGSKTTNTSAVTFESGETLSSVISGFTVQNPSSVDIDAYGASPTITGNILTSSCTAIEAFSDSAALIQGNLITGTLSSSCYGGDAISTGENSPVQIVGNLISANNGGAISVYQATGTVNVSQNTITQNHGAGIYVYSGAGPVTVIQNLITGNQGSGLSWTSPPITAISNTIANNAPSCCGTVGSEIYGQDVDGTVILENNLAVATGSSPAFYCGSASAPPTLTSNDIFAANSTAYGGACQDVTGTAGNLSLDPLFVDFLSDNFHIQAGSPAIDAGAKSAPHEPNTDMDGDPRVVGTTIDIGADEYSATTTMVLSLPTLHFPTQDVGTSSAAQTVTLTNQGKTPVTLNLIAAGPGFSETNNCGAALAASSSCKINVVFSPLLGGTTDGVLGIFTSATSNPLAVNLVGSGLAPQVQFYPSFYFYNQVIGTSSTQTGTLTNTGQAPLSISSISLTGATDFTESSNCPIAPKTLAVQASCTVSVTYAPTLIGSENAILSLNDNALPSPQTYYVNGSSVSAGAPAFSPTSLTFPTTLIGQSSAPQTVSLSNTGTGPLGITNIYSYGDFPETNTCPAVLAVGANCTITVTYTPSYQGTENGYLSVYTDSSQFQVLIPMVGTGQAPAPTLVALSPISLPAGSQNTQITLTGSGFVNGSQVLWNGSALPCCAYPNGNTQLSVTIPAANLATPGTYQISVFTPTPGGGTSSSLPFTVYQPIKYAIKSAPYDYRTITGTALNLIYGSAQITSPFPIQFGGGSYTNLTVGEGGTVSFSNFASNYNDKIPTAETQTLVAAFWAYLYAFGYNTNDNDGFWEVQGSAPNRELIIEWRDVGYCCETTGTVKFQIVFFEGSSNVLFNYADTIFGGGYSADDNGATATSGIQVAPGLGTEYSYDKPALKSATALLWYPGSPSASLSTNSLSFGYHQIGTASRPQKLTLTNGGLVLLRISSISIDNPDFTQTNDCGAIVNPGKSCAIHVYFTPSHPYSETATLTITDNASNSTQTATLTGIGSISPIVIYPIMVNFGSVKVGTTSTLPVVLANGGNTVISIHQITASPAPYSETNNCGTSLHPGESCTISVMFAPQQPGNATGAVSMALNGKKSVTEVNLVGSGQ